MKAQGTCKIGANCPSTIEVVENDQEVMVTYYKTHVGHIMELKHLTLSEAEKADLEKKIADGISFERCLDDVRSTITDHLERIHLLTRKDLLNIANAANLKSEKRHSDDAVSVQLFVKEMEQLKEFCSVIFFKPQGISCKEFLAEDFMIVLMTPVQKELFMKFSSSKICIDTTHGTNAYNFNLTTIVVVDEFGAGFPAAFCILNQIDSRHMQIFFKAVCDATCCVSTEIFMSDDAASYYNAWTAVMEKPKSKLLCSWHVDKNWRQAITKIKSKEKRVLVYKYLRTVMEEMDELQFQKLLEAYIKELNEDEETESFANYFLQNYAKRCAEWAFCFRKNAGINTNMFLEAFHRILKHVYLKGTVNKRIDTLTGSLLKLVKNRAFERYTKLIKGGSSKMVANIHNRHEGATAIKNIVEVSQTEWKVTSSKSTKMTYNVVKCTSHCQNCQLKCRICLVCIHEFSCTCINFVVRGNMCKHVHSVTIRRNQNPTQSISKDSTECVKLDEITKSDAFKSLVQHETASEGCLSLQEKLNLASSLLSKKVVSPNVKQQLHRQMDKFINLLKNEEEGFVSEANAEPANKKICLQNRFFSTKKKSVTSSSIEKPSIEFKQEIIDSVVNNSDCLNVSSSFDHTYSI